MSHHPDPTAFRVHDTRFLSLLGPTPTSTLLFENKTYPFAHEAGIYLPSANQLIVTSNRLHSDEADPSPRQKVLITRVNLSTPVSCEELPTSIPMANGGVNAASGDDSVLICGQGSLNADADAASGIYKLSLTPPYRAQLLVGSFHDRPFNSVNDVVVHSDGSVWFTDPTYGFEQGYRGPPRLPSQVYRWCPPSSSGSESGVEGKGSIRAMADGFGKPNGICFSPDEKTVYVTDTEWLGGDGSVDDARVSSIYAFDVSIYHGEPFLTNRRLFAMADKGIPDGIKCDQDGNVYSGCGDGINVWSPGGVLLGRILLEGGVANFCFGRNGEIFALNEHRLWKVQLGGHVRGALLGI
ncbi:calcium-dependent phosphotriesterase [Aspergillus steynii IBT 23096]|uniref:Calcium-dependent phosphotriesterase n=1 Tax=Aspergillus steynii IBT 23096 TaxID=1392250 RepID=A0A2I2FWA7_9EURO|nr:calcium-dependent phosphotriesterase [Aspergillus steynii IBT 23096]PLB44921.1 calcium-dependent phosphotriesterase [Aspergillus steynii IBT 23096]